MSSERSKEVRDLLRRQVHSEWTLKELESLQLLLQESSWLLFLKYLSPLEEIVSKEIWKLKTEQQTFYLRGQHDVLERIRRMDEEIAANKVLLKEYQQQQQKEA